jgi:WD40 repeat protein
MSGDEPDGWEESLASWLASCDEALAAGGQPVLGDDAGVTPAMHAQRQHGLALLRLLRQALPPKPRPQAAASEAPTLAPGQPPAATHLGPPEVPGYEVLRELGRGGMGVVYKARQVNLDRLVALKVILAGRHAGAQARARFKAEAEAVARLQHPNVVHIYDVGEHQELPFFSFELCPGGSLGDRLDGTPLPAHPAAALAETLARAVHAAHQAGIVHRDLKPANVLLAADGTPKITDFGLAKRLDAAGAPTRSGTIMGTPSYMAPEQTGATMAPEQTIAMPKGVGPATDVYALGAILYELLTGRPPFKGSSPMNTVLQLLTCEPVPPRALVPKVPRDLETICLKCLHKDARKRYASAAELAEDLRRFQAGEPIRARPISPWARGLKWAKRNPVLASLLGSGGLALLALAVMTVALFYSTRLQAALGRAQRIQYAADMGLAQRAWQENQVPRALELLERYDPGRHRDDPDLRGFEWHYLWRLCHSDLFTLTGHAGGVRAVAYSPDGRRLASASADGTVMVWDAQTGDDLLTLTGHSLAGRKVSVSAVVFSPDGKHLASAATDQTVKLWDVQTGRETFTLQGHATPDHETTCCLAFSPDGKHLAGVRGGPTDPGAGQAGPEVKIWDTATGMEVLSLRGHTGEVISVAFSPDGRRLASAGLAYDAQKKTSGELKVWTLETGRELFSSAPGSVVNGVAFSPDGRRLAAASSDGTASVRDASDGHELLALKGHTLDVLGVAYNRDGSRLATASADRTLRVWDAQTGRELFSLQGHADIVWGVAWSPDGTRLASASDDTTVKMWDAQTSQEPLTLRGHTGEVYGVAFSPDSQRLASAGRDGAVKVWDAATGREDLALDGHWGPVRGVAFSPDGTRLASANEDGTVRVWDAQTGGPDLRLAGHTGPVRAVAYSPDGTNLASASEDGTVKLWDAQTGQEVLALKVHTLPVFGVAFSPDGKRLASAVGDGTVRVWDVRTGQKIFSIQGHVGPVQGVAYSPDGRHLASASMDKTVKLWDAQAGGWGFPSPQDHSAYILSVAFSPDGRRLATASFGQTVKVWGVETAQELLSFQGPPGWGRSVAFSPSGNRLAAANGDGTVTVWDATAAR